MLNKECVPITMTQEQNSLNPQSVKALISWRKSNDRPMPWRARVHQKSNPYHVFISEIMLQQTTVQTVIPFFNRFITRWPTLEAAFTASLDDILHAFQGLGYYRRAHNFYKALAMIQKDFKNKLPQNETELLKLPGVGPYTAAAIAAIAYHEQTVPVDGNIKRVFARLTAFDKDPAKHHTFIYQSLRTALQDDEARFFAEGLMDLGATLCKPRTPLCQACPLTSFCKAYGSETQSLYPKRALKKKTPQKYGSVFWIENDHGEVLTEKRPEKGLLGGLMGFPTTPWESEPLSVEAHHAVPLKKKVKHVFTHFTLHLTILKEKPPEKILENQQWVKKEDLHTLAFPTLMRKVEAYCLESDASEK